MNDYEGDGDNDFSHFPAEWNNFFNESDIKTISYRQFSRTTTSIHRSHPNEERLNTQRPPAVLWWGITRRFNYFNDCTNGSFKSD